MRVAIDFGISNTDIAILDNGELTFHSTPSTKNSINCSLIKNFFSNLKIPIENVEVIGVTGGKSSDLDNSMNGIKIIKINEIDAIGMGAKKLYEINDESTLVVSAGTGTACVHVHGNNFNHLGGIAVGGGMLEGLGSLLFKNSHGLEINEFAQKGSRAELDLLIGDVVNKIGNLSSEITAVNFGQAKNSSADTMENTSAALCNMIGEVIGTVAYLNALLVGSDKACFIGRTSYLSEITDGINQRLELAGIKGQYNDHREYGNVIGVLESIETNSHRYKT
jgi:type II pantothenate kinase